MEYYLNKNKVIFIIMGLLLNLLCGCAGSTLNTVQDTFRENTAYSETTVSETSDINKMVVDNTDVENADIENADIQDKRSIKNLLQTSLKPLGNTMYIWGGGWNEEDTGSGIESVTIGVSPCWKEFADCQDADYDYKKYDYQIHDGLDCSGYIGWLIYNVLEDESYVGDESGYVEAGYVVSSSEMADKLALKGFGDVKNTTPDTIYYPGDIVSMKGHVWMAIGTLEDKSVLLIHSSPPGVKISGTLLDDGSKSLAVSLAEKIMKEHYGKWYERYPDCAVKHAYLENARVFHWNSQTLKDDEGLLKMPVEEMLNIILNEAQ